jgi:hypothetical protein
MDFVRNASDFDLTLVGEMDLTCEQKVVSWSGRSYTFCNLLFRRSSGEARPVEDTQIPVGGTIVDAVINGQTIKFFVTDPDDAINALSFARYVL